MHHLLLYPDIGAIVIDPLATASVDGLQFFMPIFLEMLTKFCDKRSILLIADESATAVRTGKFFASAWYPSFQPDLYMFGADLLMAGITCAPRWAHRLNWDTFTMKEVNVDAVAALRCHTILNLIQNSNMMEAAITTGATVLDELHKLEIPLQIKDEHLARGIGLLIWSCLPFVNKPDNALLAPPLNFGIENIPSLLARSIIHVPQYDSCAVCGDTERSTVGPQCNICDRHYHYDCIRWDSVGLTAVPRHEVELPETIFVCQNCGGTPARYPFFFYGRKHENLVQIQPKPQVPVPHR